MNRLSSRRVIAFIYDCMVIPVAWFSTYWLRDNFQPIGAYYLEQAIQIVPIVFFAQIFFFWYLGLYRGMWRFASVVDLIRIMKSVIFGVFLAIFILFMMSSLSVIPRSIFPLHTIFLIFLLGGGRFGFRIFKEFSLGSGDVKNVLIIGAGSAGENLARDIKKHKDIYKLVAFIDDNKKKIGQEIHNTRIVAGTEKTPEIVKKMNIDVIFIAVPSASAAQMRNIVDICEKANVTVSTLPGINDLIDGRVTVGALRSVAIEDLLGRDPVDLQQEKVKPFLSNKSIMVTGGGGSIGSELCLLIAQCKPKKLLIIDNTESNLYEIENSLTTKYPNVNVQYLLQTVTNEKIINQLLEEHKPDMIFHSAAYKHVPLLEKNILSGFINNVVGTYVMAKCSAKNNIGKFILISTDKAVEPANFMGATKRVAEIVCQYFQARAKTQYITVRFGNVLASKGSVVPLFHKQIKSGGPVTVTHPKVERYFMTIQEAALLILKTSLIGSSGEVYVLDMGEPINITYLAEQMIKLSGKIPYKEVDIKYIGLRPGEKLTERLFYNNEKLRATGENKLFQSNAVAIEDNKVDVLLTKLQENTNSEHQAFAFVKEMLPDFKNQD